MSQTPATSPARSPASARALIAFEGVQKSYDGVTQVVKNLNLEIAEGEFLCLAPRARARPPRS
jgi:ATPase subunit of ABC transporter with duplicated ATPase domains